METTNRLWPVWDLGPVGQREKLVVIAGENHADVSIAKKIASASCFAVRRFTSFQMSRRTRSPRRRYRRAASMTIVHTCASVAGPVKHEASVLGTANARRRTVRISGGRIAGSSETGAAGARAGAGAPPRCRCGRRRPSAFPVPDRNSVALRGFGAERN